MNSSKNLGATVLNKITPECANIGQSIKMSSTIVLVMVVIALILLVSAVIYNYVKKEDSNADAATKSKAEDDKKKVIGALNITGIVLVFLTALSAIWELSVVSKAANRCIPTVVS